ncbi:MAG: hypothetical protein FWD57_11925 [Polyangiaceae bacterium]|nr:hypothetical protein [Polyangiaceae bacterium]
MADTDSRSRWELSLPDALTNQGHFDLSIVLRAYSVLISIGRIGASKDSNCVPGGGLLTTESSDSHVEELYAAFSELLRKSTGKIDSPARTNMCPVVGINAYGSAFSDIDLTTREMDMMRVVQSTYEFRNQDAVVEFIRANPYLLPPLVGIPGHIFDAFGKDTALVLRVESESVYAIDTGLVVMVRDPSRDDESLKRLEAFEEDWWLDHMDDARDKILIMLEYV